MRLAAILLAAFLILPAYRPVAAAGGDIAEARQLLKRAERALADARESRESLVALGKAVHAQETALAAYRAALRRLTTEERRLTAALGAESARTAALLGALQGLSNAPGSALLAYPGGPVHAARAATLMAAITPELETRRVALAVQLDALRQIRADQAAAQDEAEGMLAALQTLRAETVAAIESRRRAAPPSSVMREQAEAAAKSAKSLGGLAERLDAALGERASVSFDAARGRLALPVAGTPVAGFGDRDPWGRKGRGITLEAPAYAQVVAPSDGVVRYAGPLTDYGDVVILEPDQGWLIVLAGLANSRRAAGEAVLAGEPLGDLGGPLPANAEFLLEVARDDGQIGAEALYIELRQEGVPVDPAPWFGISGK